MALLHRLQALADMPGGSAAQLYNWAEEFHARYALVIEQVLYVLEQEIQALKSDVLRAGLGRRAWPLSPRQRFHPCTLR